jgi:hypothetical protein
MIRISWRSWRANQLFVASFLGLSALVAITATACDPGAGVTWSNETDQTVVLYLSHELNDRGTILEPHSTKTQAVIEAVWKGVVVVRDQRGNVLLREDISWDQLKAQHFRFVIRQDMLAPTPSAVP